MRRHDLVFVRRGAAYRPACGELAAPVGEFVRDWIDFGRPLVAARQPADAASVLLGLSLPKTLGRKRVGILVDRSEISDARPPLAVRHCLHCLPPDVAETLDELATRLQRCGVSAGVFGSLAWEVLANAPYRHSDSDIDLLFDVGDAGQLAALVAELTRAAPRLACRLDGEIRFPDGNAVAWRELADTLGTPDAMVLAKGSIDVALLPVRALLATLRPGRHDA